jgi:hypothetical protein
MTSVGEKLKDETDKADDVLDHLLQESYTNLKVILETKCKWGEVKRSGDFGLKPYLLGDGVRVCWLCAAHGEEEKKKKAKEISL